MNTTTCSEGQPLVPVSLQELQRLSHDFPKSRYIGVAMRRETAIDLTLHKKAEGMTWLDLMGFPVHFTEAVPEGQIVPVLRLTLMGRELSLSQSFNLMLIMREQE
jgi:hypothetical protein